MYRAEDYKSGYGQRKKPNTPILPYLRAKQAEKEALDKSKEKAEKPPHKPQDKEAERTDTEESYAEAIHKIVTGAE